MSRFLDKPDPEEPPPPLFPDHWSCSTYQLALTLEVFVILLGGQIQRSVQPGGLIGYVCAAFVVISLAGTTVPFLFAPAPWLTRIRYAFTGGLFWVLMLIPLGIVSAVLFGFGH